MATTLLEKFPNTPSLTLAKMLYRQAPELWTSVDRARSMVRYLRGASGSTHRQNCTDKSAFREPQAPGDVFGALPKPTRTLARWKIVPIPGPLRILGLMDIHIPYHDYAAVRCALEYGRKHDVDTIMLNWDVADHYSISHWETDPRQRDFPDEVRKNRQFLCAVRNAFPKARIIWKLGNHEERYIHYMRVKAPELLGIPEFEFDSVMHTADHGVEVIGDMRPIKTGAMHWLHGHEYRFAISNPVNPARGLFLRAKCNSLCGHFHQSSQHSENTLPQHVISTWSCGCLCDLHPEYRPINNWNHGYLLVEVDKSGAFQVLNRRIVDGHDWN